MFKIFPALLILFVAEIAVIIKVGQTAGVFCTLTALFVSMMIGTVLVKLSFRKAVVSAAEDPVPRLSLLWVPLAGFFFIFPGFISDVLGLLILLPPLQRLLERRLMKKAGMSGISGFARGFEHRHYGGTTVDASYTEVEDPLPQDSGKDQKKD